MSITRAVAAQIQAAEARAAQLRVAQVRVGDAEREAAVCALGEHFVAGRISQQELDDRTSHAYAARTNSDLWSLFRDLPALPPPGAVVATGAGRAARRGSRGPAVVPLLLVVVALLALADFSWPVVLADTFWLSVLVVAGLWWSRSSARHRAVAQSNGSRRAVRGSWS